MKRKLHSLIPIRRVQRICATLNRARRPITHAQLAAQLEVSYNTIARDVAYMRDQLELPIAANSAGLYLTEKVELCRCCAGRLNGKGKAQC